MGLKGYRLWVMGQLDSNVQSPTAVSGAPSRCVSVDVSRLVSDGFIVTAPKYGTTL
jgi:hypothetical protein